MRAVRYALMAGLGLMTSLAAWTAATTPGGNGAARGLSLPAGDQPSAAAAGVGSTSVLVSWTASSGGAPVAGYEIKSYNAATNATRAVGAGCSGIIGGTTCTETGVPAGSWKYTVTPRQQAWRGAESPPSSPAVVDLTRPQPTGLTLSNGNGVIDVGGGDEVTITFSEPLAPSSICSAWTGSGDQVLAGSGVTVNVSTGFVVLGPDVVTVTATGCTLHVGNIVTSGDYVTSNSTFGGSTTATESRVTWTAATNTLTIHIGARISGLVLGITGLLPGNATYQPDAAITDLSGQPIVTTDFTVGGQRL